MVALERTILATYLFADTQLTDEETNSIRSIELMEECFKEHYHKIIVGTINNLRATKKPYYFEYVVEEMQSKGIFNENAFNEIMFTNQITANTFHRYLVDFEGSSMMYLHGDI